MKFLDIPNLPEGNVALAVVDGRMDSETGKSLLGYGIKLVKTCCHCGVYNSVASHPDIMLHHIGGSKIVYAPGTYPGLIKYLENFGYTLIQGETCLSNVYPGSIHYNAARVGNIVFHNLKYTDTVMIKEFKKLDLEMVHVKQGYTKCSISIVNKGSIITSDKGIVKAAEKKGIEALYIEPDHGIRLEGMDYGFIGGASGLIAKRKWVVAGRFEMLASAGKIYDFLNRHGVDVVSLSERCVKDIGSILPLACSI